MKKIIIVSDSLRIGGIQTSLKNLLNNIDYRLYDVSLLLFNDTYSNDLPKKLHLLKSNYMLRIMGLTLNEAKKKGILIYFIRVILALLCKIFGSNLVCNFLFFFMKKRRGYDVAISYSNNGEEHSVYYGYNKFVLKKVQAPKKITYLHVDYEVMHLNTKNNKKEYNQFDKILTVSNYTRNIFLKYNPNLLHKTEVLYNFLPNNINENLKDPYVHDLPIIVSVGRLDENKNPLEQIEIVEQLIKENIKVKLYLIGDGALKKDLLYVITERKLQEYVYLFESQKKVYSYIKYADIYLSTSKSESYGLSIAEALLLNTIVVAKEYPALYEIIDKNNGYICKSKDEIIKLLKILLTDKNVYRESKENAKLINNNENNLKKLNTILGE